MGCCECCRQRSLTYCLISGRLVAQEEIPVNGVEVEPALGTLEPILHVQFMNEYQACLGQRRRHVQAKTSGEYTQNELRGYGQCRR